MDLYYRLAVIPIQIPPLRERRWDIEELVRHFLLKYNLVLGKKVIGVTGEVMDLFWEYNWPGNVRELEHIIESAVNMINSNEDRLQLKHLSFHLDHLLRFRPEAAAGLQDNQPSTAFPHFPEPDKSPIRDTERPVQEPIQQQKENLERKSLEDALTAADGNMAKAARSLGISRQLFHYKMKKLKISCGKPLQRKNHS
jgi:arginine utilization regulatory protein